MANRIRVLAVITLVGLVTGTLYLNSNAQAAKEKGSKKADAALKRTRASVAMLDDIYKHAVVLITTHYVNEDSDLPAGTAAKALFAYAKKKGYHDVRLLDASGEPIEEDNVAKDEFEKSAIASLKKGENWVEKVEERDGKRYLRVATPIPVVLEKCIMCHENYRNVPKGQPIGALGYTVPIK